MGGVEATLSLLQRGDEVVVGQFVQGVPCDRQVLEPVDRPCQGLAVGSLAQFAAELLEGDGYTSSTCTNGNVAPTSPASWACHPSTWPDTPVASTFPCEAEAAAATPRPKPCSATPQS